MHLTQSYVVQAMWIAIMTLAMSGTVYYLIYFDRHVRANSTHRLAALVRASVAISRGNTSVVAGERLVRAVVRQSLSRSRVLILITVLFIFSWYPLYILTLVDPRFEQPSKVYKLLTFVAWSNAAVNPVVLILFDNNVDALRRLTCYMFPACDGREDVDVDARRHKAHRATEMTSTSSAGPTRGASTPRGGRPLGGGPAPGGRSRRRAGPAAADTCSPTGSIYERVGNRLWREGESSPVIVHSQTFSGGLRRGGRSQQCNGLVGTDDNSMRRPHTSQLQLRTQQQQSRDWPLLNYEMETVIRH